MTVYGTTNVVRLCNQVTIVYHDKLEADRPMHSIAAFEVLFLARLTTWIALVFCVGRKFTLLSVAETKKACNVGTQ